MKNFKNKCWHPGKVVVLCNTSLRKTPQRHRKSRMRTSEMRKAPTDKNKKVEKSCWQTEKAVIWYQSCSGRETTENNERTLITEQWNNLENSWKSFIFKELTFKNSKKGMNSQVVILTWIKPRQMDIWLGERAKFICASAWNSQHTHFIREFDPGSGWTLAACLTHASRTRDFEWDFGGF